MCIIYFPCIYIYRWCVDLYRCKSCPSSFGSCQGLLTHRTLYHLGGSSKSLTCSICQQIFASRSTLWRHRELYHVNAFIHMSVYKYHNNICLQGGRIEAETDEEDEKIREEEGLNKEGGTVEEKEVVVENFDVQKALDQMVDEIFSERNESVELVQLNLESWDCLEKPQ